MAYFDSGIRSCLRNLMHIVALTTCHNRREKTLQSLKSLYSQKLPLGVNFEVTIVNDGSTDGTTLAVKQTFPDVEIIEGNGNLYWAGGMRFGWEESVRHKKFDFLFVYNDDIHLKQDALAHLIEISSFVSKYEGLLHVIIGAFTDQSSQNTTYGGLINNCWWHPLRFKRVDPTGNPQKVDTLNMNAALITYKALDQVGFLANYFQHSGADYEYGLRLRKAGGTIWLSSNSIGWCDRNSIQGTMYESNISLRERLYRLFSLKGHPLYQSLRYYKDHGGVFWLILWLGLYLREFLRLLKL